ncbi:MAG: hypothetical protein ACR2MO_01345 [Acidimicrobiales bacterium]
MPENEESTMSDRGHRVPEGEGISAPLAAESGGPPQTSVFDGAGNESVVTLGVNEDGRVAEGTGATLDDAMKDAEQGDSLLGDDFDPKHAPK